MKNKLKANIKLDLYKFISEDTNGSSITPIGVAAVVNDVYEILFDDDYVYDNDRNILYKLLGDFNTKTGFIKKEGRDSASSLQFDISYIDDLLEAIDEDDYTTLLWWLGDWKNELEEELIELEIK